MRIRRILRRWAPLAVIVLIGAVALILYYQRDSGAPTTTPPEPSPSPPELSTEPKHPIPFVPPETEQAQEAEEPAVPPEPPLPALAASDEAVQRWVTELFGKKVLNLLISKDVIRHIVVTIDNLPRQKLADKLMPTRPAPGKFVTSGTEEAITMSPDNYPRYQAFVDVLSAVDSQEITALYFRLYPLFQEAYEELGYPSAYFNDRLVEVIDHLLATPRVDDPVRLVQPKVFYEFLNPDLEGRSAGQKILIRMGPANADIVKGKLAEIREQVTVKP